MKEQRAATIRQGIIRMLTGYKEIPKKTLSRQTTVLDFLKSSVETRASPFVLLDIGDNDLNNQPIVQEEVPPPKNIVSFHVYCKLFTSTNISSYWPQQIFHNHTPHLDTAFMEINVSTCVVPTNFAGFSDTAT